MNRRVGFVLVCASVVIACDVNRSSAEVITQWNFGTVTSAPYNNPAPDIGSGAASVLGMDNNYIFSSGNTITGTGTLFPAR